MKYINKFLAVGLLAVCVLSYSSCGKDGTSFCEVIVNENGPGFLKVTNNLSQEIFVDLTSIIPLGAHTRSGACEIFGLPTGDHTITIENENGSAAKDIDFTIAKDDTYTLSVSPGFF